MTLQERLEIPVLSPDGTRSSISRGRLPSPLHLAASLARYRHLALGDRLRLARPAMALRRLDPDDPTLDRQTFGSWLTAHGQHRDAIDRLWNLIILPTVNVTAQEASLALAVKVFRTGLLDEADAGDVGWSTVPLARLHADNAPARAGRRRRRDGPRGTGSFGHANGATAALEVTTGTPRARGDAVIVTTPPDESQGPLPPGRSGPIEGLGWSPIVNVHLVFDRQVTDLPMAATVGSPAQFIFDRTTSAGRGDRTVPLDLAVGRGRSTSGVVPTNSCSPFTGAIGDLFPAARRPGWSTAW